jgi:anti-sigma factor ChrR (cupin superfamily)
VDNQYSRTCRRLNGFRWPTRPYANSSPASGCDRCGAGANGASAHVVELDPGSCWEGIDVHEPGPEEVYVVTGIFNDGTRDYPAGSFIHCPAGSSHVPQSTQGCTLFVFYPEG